MSSSRARPASCLAVALVGGVLVWPTLVGGQGRQETPVFRSGARTVALYVTVTDAAKRLVPGLTVDDFEIYDNKKKVDITLFDNQVQPITVAVMLDTSASMTLTLDLLKAAAEQFVIRLLPDDRAKVGAFNDKIQLFPSGPFIGDRDELVSILKNDLQFGNPTRLYDAVNFSLDALQGIEGRRVVLVFTDGDDTGSQSSRGDALKRAQHDEVMIYAIGLQSDYFNGQSRVRTKPDRGLKKLAEDTGGGYFELTKTADLASTFTRVEQELHSQYLMGFSPEVLDGKEHKLEVRVKDPSQRARARNSYVASEEALGKTP